MENQDAKAVDVRHRRRRSSEEQLRGQIERRSGDLVLRRDPPGQLGAGAEVHEDDAAAVLAHDVLALHVAVQEARTVHRRQGLTEIDADPRRLAGRKTPGPSARSSSERPRMYSIHRPTRPSTDSAP